MRLRLSLIPCLFSVIPLIGAEPDGSFRVAGQLLFGTAGIEPGAALEWTFMDTEHPWRLRPEVFVNEDGSVGLGASLAWKIPWSGLGDGNQLFLGPRVVFHDSDDHGWEASALAIFSIPLVRDNPDRHFIEIIGAAGIVQEKRHPGTDSEFSGTLGVAYAYRF